MPPLMISTAGSNNPASSAADSSTRTKNIRSKEQLQIAKLVKTAMGHFEKCLFEVKDAYQSLAFNLIEIDAEIDSRRLSLEHYALKPADGEPEWIPKSVRYRDTTHGLSKDMQARLVYKNIIDESNILIDAV